MSSVTFIVCNFHCYYPIYDLITHRCIKGTHTYAFKEHIASSGTYTINIHSITNIVAEHLNVNMTKKSHQTIWRFCKPVATCSTAWRSLANSSCPLKVSESFSFASSKLSIECDRTSLFVPDMFPSTSCLMGDVVFDFDVEAEGELGVNQKSARLVAPSSCMDWHIRKGIR